MKVLTNSWIASLFILAPYVALSYHYQDRPTLGTLILATGFIVASVPFALNHRK